MLNCQAIANNMSQKTISSKPKPLFTKKWFLIPTISLLLLGSFILYLAISWGMFHSNYAREIATPIERELIAAGAVKKCERGDNGKGFDNTSPSYGADFETDMNAEKANQLIQDVAKKTGYSLKQDAQWPRLTYTDKTRLSLFKDLEPGSIELHMAIYNDTENVWCSGNTYLRNGKDNVVIGIGVSLPSYY